MPLSKEQRDSFFKSSPISKDCSIAAMNHLATKLLSGAAIDLHGKANTANERAILFGYPNSVAFAKEFIASEGFDFWCDMAFLSRNELFGKWHPNSHDRARKMMNTRYPGVLVVVLPRTKPEWTSRHTVCLYNIAMKNWKPIAEKLMSRYSDDFSIDIVEPWVGLHCDTEPEGLVVLLDSWKVLAQCKVCGMPKPLSDIEVCEECDARCREHNERTGDVVWYPT